MRGTSLLTALLIVLLTAGPSPAAPEEEIEKLDQAREEGLSAEAAGYWEQFIGAVRKDPNRSFWIPYAEEKLGRR